MGQRLNIEIIKDGETLANAYYHWSAYSKTAADLARIIIKNINSINKNDSDLIQAIKLLETTLAGLPDREIEYARTIDELKDVDFIKCTGRNDGLIAISKDEINTNRKWQEYALYIYLDEERMSFKVFDRQPRWDYERDYEDYEHTIQFDDMEIFDINFDDIKFKDIDKFVDFVNDYLDEPFRTYLDMWDVFSFIN